jgi:hypothetical protein
MSLKNNKLVKKRTSPPRKKRVHGTLNKVKDMIIMAEHYQNLAYNKNFENPNDDYCWWGLHETCSLFHQYLQENDVDAYTEIGTGLIEMLESNPLTAEFKLKLEELFVKK